MLLVLAVLAALQPADVPLPRPRPAISAGPVTAVETPHGPDTACDKRLYGAAVFDLRPDVAGPGACGGQDLVTLRAVRLATGKDVAVQPPALLRCEMAESFAAWIRDAVAPRIASAGAELAAVRQEDAYSCRLRNRASSGKLSEHAHGNALDIQAFVLADRHAIVLSDVREPRDLRDALRLTACHRFTTVLGPGEPAHDLHIHLDIIERRGGYRICSWDVREPAAPVLAKRSGTPAATTGAAVPLPPVRHPAR